MHNITLKQAPTPLFALLNSPQLCNAVFVGGIVFEFHCLSLALCQFLELIYGLLFYFHKKRIRPVIVHVEHIVTAKSSMNRILVLLKKSKQPRFNIRRATASTIS